MALSKASLDRYLDEITERITTIASPTKPYQVDPSGICRLRTISNPQQRAAGKAAYCFRATTLFVATNLRSGTMSGGKPT